MPRTWRAAQIAALAGQHPEWFGLAAVPAPVTAVVDHLGDGESYAAWTARVAGAPRDLVVVRAARRAVGELPAAPAEEFAGLALAPPGLAPEPIALTEVRRLVGKRAGSAAAYPIIVETLARGRVRAPVDWTARAREHLAAGFARLHERVWAAPGAVTTREANPRAPIRFDAHIDSVVEYWARQLRVDGTPFDDLVGPMTAYAAAVAPRIAAVAEFALLHGDPVLTNVLVDEQERITLVDWEWTQIGDPARDLAFLGGAIHADPWYAALNDAEITAFLRAYIDAGGRGDLADLRARRDAWLAAEAFGVLGYLLWLDADPAQRASPWHVRGAAGLARTLGAYLGRHPRT